LYTSFDELNRAIVACVRCPRLVEYREAVAFKKTKRFADWDYWGKPLAGFGDPDAEILIVGLAPAAHGGNRTGRMFTGDSSGDTLMGSLYRVGLANKPTSTDRHDGLALRHVYITAALRCAPPGNRPLRSELDNCFDYLAAELKLLRSVRVIVPLGRIGFNAICRLLGLSQKEFGHGVVLKKGEVYVLPSYHPSRRNTQTGLLKPEMLDAVFLEAKRLSGISDHE
jgi:uracil-DNA glycosylase family 4